jgi:hypothetical protein
MFQDLCFCLWRIVWCRTGVGYFSGLFILLVWSFTWCLSWTNDVMPCVIFNYVVWLLQYQRLWCGSLSQLKEKIIQKRNLGYVVLHVTRSVPNIIRNTHLFHLNIICHHSNCITICQLPFFQKITDELIANTCCVLRPILVLNIHINFKGDALCYCTVKCFASTVFNFKINNQPIS